MSNQAPPFTLTVEGTRAKCPVGEKVGAQNATASKIPVLSCEGACIRGEIARQAANLVAERELYSRACHGELFTVPESAMRSWVDNAERVVLIDGCFLRCHGRILQNLVQEDKLVQFDAHAFYKKYTDKFEIDSVPESERNQVARDVADWVIQRLERV